MSILRGPLLVLGGSGQLGDALVGRLRALSRPFFVPSRSDLDLSDTEKLGPALESIEPRAVVNAAAFTDVAGAEQPENRDLVFRVNRDAPAALAQACRKLGVPLVHVSTDYVFDGRSARPYRENDPTRPLQVYGLSKLLGEEAVLSTHSSALVVRTSTLFGPAPRQRPNYVDAILDQARRSPVLSVVELPVASPTYAPHLAEALLELLEAEASGILHVVNDGACSRLELARAALEEAGLADSIRLESRHEPAGSLPRPVYSALDTSRFESIVGRRLPPWRQGVREHVEASRP